MFRKVVVGANESATAREAVHRAADFVRMVGGELHMVTAYHPRSVETRNVPPEFKGAMTTDPADEVLEDLASVVKGMGVDPVVHASTEDAADALVQVAQDVGADLIVVGNKGMRGARRILGSVPNSVAHNAPCSVLILDTT